MGKLLDVLMLRVPFKERGYPRDAFEKELQNLTTAEVPEGRLHFATSKMEYERLKGMIPEHLWHSSPYLGREHIMIGMGPHPMEVRQRILVHK